MKTELALHQMSVPDAMTMAKTFAESGLFKDTSDMAKAFVKIQAGQEIGIAPFQAMSGIHIIQGKPTIGAGIMASKIKGSGKYDYRVTRQDNDACVIEFFQGKESIGISSFTKEEAIKAGTQNMGKYPKNMLFARAISNGLKWYCPDVFSGPVYVPEEMGGVETEDATYTDITPSAEPEIVKHYITPKMFGQLLERLKKGETDVISKASEKFLFTEEQLDSVKAIEEEIFATGEVTA